MAGRSKDVESAPIPIETHDLPMVVMHEMSSEDSSARWQGEKETVYGQAAASDTFKEAAIAEEGATSASSEKQPAFDDIGKMAVEQASTIDQSKTTAESASSTGRVPALFGTQYTDASASTNYIRLTSANQDAKITDSSGVETFVLDVPKFGTSWSVRRKLCAAPSGPGATPTHILDVRHYRSSLSTWILEDAQGSECCIVKDTPNGRPKHFFMHARTTVKVAGAVDIVMRPVDAFGMQTVFEVAGTIVAEMHLVQKDSPRLFRYSSDCISLWRLSTRANVDKALMLGLALIRVEVHSARKR